ncbi:tetratricopeptide repeat protein [Belliella marina]|uniref:Tetratricopeptide repeat protein n=1 Tax=Belliella marina TaxID=1644146 RepID=A0ABW4VJL1_9BACT
MNGRFLLIILGVLVLGCEVKYKESKQSLESEPSEVAFSKEELIEKANSFYKEDDCLNSVKYLSKLIKIDSTNGEFIFKRGYCYARIDSLNASTLDYIKAAELEHRVADAYYNIGLNYTMQFDDSMALKYFFKALEINPKDQEISDEIKAAKERLNHDDDINEVTK